MASFDLIAAGVGMAIFIQTGGLTVLAGIPTKFLKF